MKRVFVILGAFLAFSAFNAGIAQAKEKNLIYNFYAREGGKSRPPIAVTTLQYKDLSEGRTAISRQKKDTACEDRDEFILDQNNAVVSWTRQCGDTTDIAVERQGQRLTVQGTLNGKKINKEIELGDKALHIYAEYSLSKFAMSGEPKMNFWTLRRDRMDKLPMQAVNMGKTKIKVNGKKVAVIKVYYSITPKFREKYYHHNFYYRKSDGLYVKKEEMDGKVEELVKEK